MSGRATLISDTERRDALARQFVAERKAIGAAPATDDELFEFDIDSCLLTRTTGHGDPAPNHTIWHSKLPFGARAVTHRRAVARSQ